MSQRQRAEYFRDYRATVKKRLGWREKMLYREGFLAARDQAIGKFRAIGAREMTGYTAMEIMRELSVGQ